MNDHDLWSAVKERISNRFAAYQLRFGGKYLLICVRTRRFAIGDPSQDEHGGHIDASENFDRKHGSMTETGEQSRSFFGIKIREAGA